jgi:hypothetical protein
VIVIRHVLTKTNHPLTGMANEFQWQALKIDVKGGPLAAKFTDHGSAAPVAPLRLLVKDITSEPPPVTLPEPLPFSEPEPVQTITPPVQEVLILDPDPVPAAEVFRFACVHCGRRVKANIGDTGKRCRCPKCGTRFQVPAPVLVLV